MELCVAVSKENSEILLSNSDISYHFLCYRRGDWYFLNWELTRYLDDVITDGTVFIVFVRNGIEGRKNGYVILTNQMPCDRTGRFSQQWHQNLSIGCDLSQFRAPPVLATYFPVSSLKLCSGFLLLRTRCFRAKCLLRFSCLSGLSRMVASNISLSRQY